MTDTRYDPRPEDKADQPMVKARPEDTIFQAPYSAPPADDKMDGQTAPSSDKPEKKTRDEMTPAEKAADTRAKNQRKAEREERKATKEAEAAAEAGHPANDEPAESAFRRTWSCPQCGRGTTLGPDQQPPTIMRCEGCGRDSAGDTWLPPGVGHGEPTLQVGPPRP